MAITLKAARVNRGLTQKQAAKMLGITDKTLFNYEMGVSFPDVPMIDKILKLYNLKYDDINFLPRNDDLIVKKGE